MGEIVIYGASDDLIEVAGNVQEELYASYGEPTYFHVGDWEFKAIYSPDGEWLFDVVDHPEGRTWTHLDVGESDEYKEYSEVVRFDGPSGADVGTVEDPR